MKIKITKKNKTITRNPEKDTRIRNLGSPVVPKGIVTVICTGIVNYVGGVVCIC